ncbi:MAG: hypothetical protein EXQ49_11305 [Acidobacteria bacterium]|nr:hypothetical protein [Acidobacteriota bacterium]
MRVRTTLMVAAIAAVSIVAACSGKGGGSPTAPSTTSTTTTGGGTSAAPPVYVVLFTHIEDNTPSGTLDTAANRTLYLTWRTRLITMAELAQRYGMTWVLQPDWKFLEAARTYENASVMSTTGGKNIFRYLRDQFDVVIDPHSHENGGYNYTDVAYLLDVLGVGGSTVIGGHIWDPSLPQFAHWDRFRAPVAGEQYPSSLWRGDILMGSGTPNHTNDPIVSGVWRPADPWNYFKDSPSGNIACIGAFKSDIDGINELVARYTSGQSASTCMLTSTYHITPTMISSSSGLSTLERDLLSPLSSLRSSGKVEVTDFTTLVATWKSRFGGQACIYRQ